LQRLAAATAQICARRRARRCVGSAASARPSGGSRGSPPPSSPPPGSRRPAWLASAGVLAVAHAAHWDARTVNRGEVVEIGAAWGDRAAPRLGFFSNVHVDDPTDVELSGAVNDAIDRIVASSGPEPRPRPAHDVARIASFAPASADGRSDTIVVTRGGGLVIYPTAGDCAGAVRYSGTLTAAEMHRIARALGVPPTQPPGNAVSIELAEVTTPMSVGGLLTACQTGGVAEITRPLATVTGPQAVALTGALADETHRRLSAQAVPAAAAPDARTLCITIRYGDGGRTGSSWNRG
jgi:hypothetical protein